VQQIQVAPPPSHTAQQRRAHLMRELVETLLFVGLVFVIVQFAVKPYRITGNNMQPQLQPDQLVVVNKAAYLFAGPSRGDVVVYVNPTDLGQQLIGRVIAVPGDTITITATQVIVNGVSLNEKYVANVIGSGNPVIVPQTKLKSDTYWIMNDSRLAKDDSRSFGTIARQNVVGKAVLVFWPASSFGGVSNFSDVFKDVH
jgi:signal peptidase I